MPKYTRNLETVTGAFDRDTLAEICAMREVDFGRAFGLDAEIVDQKDDNYYFFRDNGASVLAVAHLDTVVYHDQRAAQYHETDAGLLIRSGALDDRLGAYTILDLMPRCGIEYDVLLTIGEESGQSTAAFFEAEKEYDWLIEFDRGGTDVVMYQYDDEATRNAVRRTGAPVGDGIFSDISYMSHVGAKGFNWGVGYRDYHSVRGHAYIDDYLSMMARYLKFHQQNAGLAMPHDIADEQSADEWWTSYRKGDDHNWWNDDEYVADGKSSLFDRPTGGYHGLGFDPVDDDPYVEGVYADDDYIEDPSLEEIQAAIERMDTAEAEWIARQEGRAV